jgi:hypothetical protein
MKVSASIQKILYLCRPKIQTHIKINKKHVWQN